MLSHLAKAALLLYGVPDVIFTHVDIIIPVKHTVNGLDLGKEIRVIQFAPIRVRQIGCAVQDARTTVVKRNLQADTAQPLDANDLVQQFHISEEARS